MTGGMSYVDIGWPLGLTVTGGLTWLLSDCDPLRIALMSFAYIFAGGRMGFGALKQWRRGGYKRNSLDTNTRSSAGLMPVKLTRHRPCKLTPCGRDCLRVVDAAGGERWMYESKDIIAYLEGRFAGMV